jgi:cell division protein FtsB
MNKMLNQVKESKFWKWFVNDRKHILLATILILFIVASFWSRAKTVDTLIELKNNAERISVLTDEQTATIESLTAERSSLQKKVRNLKAVKMQEKDNIKNYILTYYKTVAPVIAEEMAVRIIEKSADYNVPLVSVVAVTEVESHFNPFAISKKGARGPMQVMPRYWLKKFKLPNKYALHDIETNIDCGVQILREYLDATDNDMRKALYKYVGGDHLYIKRVYESMGKFIVFKSFTDIKVSEDEGKDEVAMNDNDKIAADLEKVASKTRSSILFTHIIKKGQMLGQLAKHYTGSVNNWPKIAEANPTIIPNRMPIGSVIIIPTNLLKNTLPLK